MEILRIVMVYWMLAGCRSCMIRVVTVFAVVFFSQLMPNEASAGSIELTGGSTFGRWGSQDEGLTYTLGYITDTFVKSEIAVGHIQGSNLKGQNLDKPVNFAALGARFQYKFVFIGLSGAYVDQTSQRLSTPWLFKTSAGITFSWFVLKVEHLSNGGLGGENDGESFATLGIHYSL